LRPCDGKEGFLKSPDFFSDKDFIGRDLSANRRRFSAMSALFLRIASSLRFVQLSSDSLPMMDGSLERIVSVFLSGRTMDSLEREGRLLRFSFFFRISSSVSP
jgi:hypothetical protein